MKVSTKAAIQQSHTTSLDTCLFIQIGPRASQGNGRRHDVQRHTGRNLHDVPRPGKARSHFFPGSDGVAVHIALRRRWGRPTGTPHQTLYAMEQDVHYKHGMTCQDCHTSLDIHGDGFLAAANLGRQCRSSVRTATARRISIRGNCRWASWMSLPRCLRTGSPQRRQRQSLPLRRREWHSIPSTDCLLTARGNPYENVVRDGDEVIVHTAAGKDIRMKPLRKLFEEKQVSLRGVVAMQGVARHLNRMECYTCHASWTPQCYGCHVKIDFSQHDKCPECRESLQAFDWVAAGRKHQQDAHARIAARWATIRSSPARLPSSVRTPAGRNRSWESTAKAAFRLSPPVAKWQ